MRMRLLLCTGLALTGLLATTVPPAQAKHGFRPGDLRICDEQSCIPIMDQTILNALSLFYYPPGRQPAKVRKPQLGEPYLQLKFRNDYVTGIAATAQFDRFRTPCNCGHFGPDDWYRVPARVALELRTLASGLQPRRVTPSIIGRTRYG
jgi:hypothetical protein